MDGRSVRYRESLLQWIWQNFQFNCGNLKLRSGEELHIEDPGKLNHGAGPDFLDAAVRIGSVTFHGSIEIHMAEGEWFEHGHHNDRNFNSVVLHVVLHPEFHPAVTHDGSSPPTLVLNEYLDDALYRLLKIKETTSLPCAGQPRFIHQKAFERQIEKAHREYFEYKVDELLQVYPPEESIQDAWRHALIRKMYNALGIPHNREAMEELFLKAVNLYREGQVGQGFEEAVVRTAFSDEDRSRFGWKDSGMRPGSRPEKRVVQAAAIHHAAMKLSFKTYLKNGVDSWDDLLENLRSEKRPGAGRLNILYSTVFLPGIYLLGDLLHSVRLKDHSYQLWKDEKFQVPEEVVRPFRESGFQISKRVKKAGLAHQYKRYCRARSCHRCEVFKSAINP